ncbi:MAG: LacI family transcriptional regulator, partial [Desulfobacterales bacterium]|nr:LacI family transcriptional regulator [Desulfobacterales bacterium]
LMAIGAIRALEDNGLSVPQEIGVAGFDNISLTALAKPRLTTIDIPAYEMGQKAMELLLGHIDRAEPMREEMRPLEVKLVRGESCKCLTMTDSYPPEAEPLQSRPRR